LKIKVFLCLSLAAAVSAYALPKVILEGENGIIGE
jgi:hypothetical protein